MIYMIPEMYMHNALILAVVLIGVIFVACVIAEFITDYKQESIAKKARQNNLKNKK